MFIVIYKFKVKKDEEEIFIDAWEQLTNMIYNHCKSKGSRLHKESENIYIAYAQWPDKSTRGNCNSLLPEKADLLRNKMRNSCAEIETLYEMEMVSDLLK